MKLKDFTGQRIGKLTVLYRAENVGTNTVWHCRCDCGNEIDVRGSSLGAGRTKSCGCIRKGRLASFTKDLAGKKIGFLTALEPAPSINRCTAWRFKCDCGNEVIVKLKDIVSGRVKSCGCYRRKHTGDMRRKHGLKDKSPRLYNVWVGMRDRCNNPNNNSYKNYGGRGITVCSEWNDFKAFYDWAMANGYDENAKRGKCTIDRIDNNGNYEPSNCRWVDMHFQNTNTRRYLERHGLVC